VTLHYDFPKIEHIDQVRNAIAGRPEFIEAERDGYTVVNYRMADSNTFPVVDDQTAAILRECRGIVFGPNGRVIARRLHKFFNVNERPDTTIGSVDLSKPHVILEKLDGSMITPIRIGENFRWGTKMGVTEVALPVEEFVAAHPEYVRLAEYCYEYDMTPIFEWCSRSQRIVIDYPEDMLVLIAVRNNETGDYLSYEKMRDAEGLFEIPVVRQYPGTVASMEGLVAETRELKGAEGWVIRFNDGHMVKIKADDYVLMHRAKDSIRTEKNILALVMEEKVDDLLPILNEADQARVVAYRDRVEEGLEATVDMIYRNLREWKTMGRKEFALTDATRLDPMVRAVVFSAWDSVPCFPETLATIYETVCASVLKNCGSAAGVEKVRKLIGDARWNEEKIDE
jgi:RNA ligase